MSEAAVVFENVTKKFGDKVALDELSFTIDSGSVFGIIGPNGSGKTTTLRLILNIYKAHLGSVRVFGQEHDRAYNDQIGYLPEERGLYRKMKVNRQLKYFGNLKGMSGSKLNQAIEYWLQRMDLAECGKLRVEQLSKGMAQKIQIISAIIFNPKLVILDEPFSGLDPVNLELVNNVIHELREQGTTIILSTHDMAVAERLCDQVIMVKNGVKVLDGSIASIRTQHGQDRIHLKFDGRKEELEALPGVISLNEIGRLWEIEYSGDPQVLLATLVERKHEVSHFELAHPSLHDIFVKQVSLESVHSGVN